VPDPATTPLNKWRQVLFGLAVAAVYGYLQILHVVFGLFIALLVVNGARGACIAFYTTFLMPRAKTAMAPAPVGSLAGAAT